MMRMKGPPEVGLRADLLLTACAPAVWGSTYYVTTAFLAEFAPLTLAALRALPAALLLMLLVRRLPAGIWWARSLLLGGLNIAAFLSLLFVAAQRLPGGVAATILSMQPLIVLVMAAVMLGVPLRLQAIGGALLGVTGVAIMVLTPAARLDGPGLLAAATGAVAMATGTVLTRRWQTTMSPLVLTAWQLTAGGLLLAPFAWAFDPPLPPVGLRQLGALGWLTVVGGALAYVLWFRGIERLGASGAAALGLLSPVSAIALGWLLQGQALTAAQSLGAALVLLSIWLCAVVSRRSGKA